MTENYAHSDLGNAQLFGDIFANSLKYRSDTQEWLQWEPGAHHWRILDRDEELRFAGYTAKHRFVSMGELDLDQQKREAAWALQSQNLPRMQSMLTYARSQYPIRSSGEEWDTHPMLLSTPTGVVNLTTGSIRPGKPEDYITQHINVPYDAEARCPRFLQFLEEIYDGNQELIQYTQRAVGYSLTGSTKEQVFFLLFGTGSNGKSKFRNVLSTLLGQYCQTVRFSAFEENPMSDSQRDLAELSGVRAVFASEGSERKKLDTSVLKYITGEEPIRASRKYGHPFTFHPQFKIWLSSNYLPRVDDNSEGFWRRIVVIPFNVTFRGASRDPDLESKLNQELSGILNWAVEGSQIWFNQGLRTPDTLLLQVSKYRDSRDTVAKFITEHCIKSTSSSVSAAELYAAYILWCSDEQEQPLSNTAFGRRMQDIQGVEKKRNAMGNVYVGLNLSSSLE